MKQSDSIAKRSALSSRIRSVDVISIMLVLSCVIMGALFFSLSHTRSALLIPAIGAVVILLAWLWYRYRCASDTAVTNILFPVALILLALMYGLVFPPESVPDGVYHYKASYYCSDAIGGSDDMHLIRAEDEEYLGIADGVPIVVDRSSIMAFKGNLGPFAASEELVENEIYSAFVDRANVSSTFVQQKLAPALGVLLAKAIGLNGYWTYMLGMLFNLLYGALLIIFSVRITPVGKKVFMAVALLPMTLHLLGSHSYDVGTLGLAFLLTAFILRAMHRKEKIGIKELLCIGITGCLLAPCKTVYSLIILLVALIPGERFSSRNKGIVTKAILIALPFAVIALLQLPGILVMFGIIQPAAEAVAQSGAEDVVQTYVLGDLLSDPGFAVSLFLNTFFVKGWEYLLTFVGSALGWLQGNLIAPEYVTAMLLVLVGLSAVPSPEDRGVLPVKARVFMLVVFVVAMLAIMLALCLDHTPNTFAFIEGVQGRYFLPLAPLLLLALRSRALRSGRRMSFTLIIAFIAVNATYIGFIFTRLL